MNGRVITAMAMILGLMGLGPMSYAEPALSLDPVVTYRGATATLNLALSNGSEPYAGVNVRLRLPNGVSFQSASPGNLLPAGFNLDSYVFNDGTSDVLALVAYSGEGAFAQNAGTILKVQLQVSGSAPVGLQTIPYAGSISGLSNVNGSTSVVHSKSSGSIKIDASPTPVLQVSPPFYDVPVIAGTRTFTVVNTGSGGTLSWSPAVTQGADWLSIASAKATGNGSFTVAFTANPNYTPRTGKIVVSSPGNPPVEVSIFQEALQKTGNGGGGFGCPLPVKYSKALTDHFKADVDTFAPVLPSRALADGTIAAGLQAPLFVRLRSAEGILPGSVWAEARTASAKYETSQWVPVDDAANTDGWAAFTPEAPWAEGDIVTLTVGATTTSGETVGPIAYVFTATAEASVDVALPEQESAIVTEYGYIDELPPLYAGIGLPYAVGADDAFAVPQRVWLPVPSGYSADELTVSYYQNVGDNMGWYPAENVEGWLVPSSFVVMQSDGIEYLGFTARHAGVAQLRLNIEPSGAAFMPVESMGDAIILASLAIMFGLWVAVRRARATVSR